MQTKHVTFRVETKAGVMRPSRLGQVCSCRESAIAKGVAPLNLNNIADTLGADVVRSLMAKLFDTRLLLHVRAPSLAAPCGHW
jgi:hypothetical protein